MAAGVGKTYRALQELLSERESGRDAVVGFLEPHGRAETVKQAQGLEVLPRRVVAHRGTELRELDVPAVVQRAPDVCLVDELAHTNAPGLPHAKRWQDIDELLDAGIDVVSTVNVQHLESLNDVVDELTGVRVRETLPDQVLRDADEVVLVDLTPRALLDRLRAGKVYEPERVPAALNGFFGIENLAALRELALRQVAEDVGAQRLRTTGQSSDEGELVGTRAEDERPRSAQATAARPVTEHLLAWVVPGPDGTRVLRRAWRSSRRLQAELDALIVRPPRPPQPDEQRAVDELARLANELHVPLLVREGDDAVKVVASVARERGTTYVLMAPPARRRLPVGLSLLDQLLEALPDVDVRVVADRTSG